VLRDIIQACICCHKFYELFNHIYVFCCQHMSLHTRTITVTEIQVTISYTLNSTFSRLILLRLASYRYIHTHFGSPTPTVS
jgi:hypothetical protein